MKLVVDNKIPYISPGLDALGRELCRRGTQLDIVSLDGAEIDRRAVADADILIVRTRTHCDRALLDGSRVRLVVTATIGFDHLDTTYLDTAGIAWTNCPGCNAGSVAQYVSSCLLLLEQERGLRLSGATLGIIGVGHVGSAVERCARMLGMGRILLNDPPLEADGQRPGAWTCLPDLLAMSDVITLHTPLTREGQHATWHLLDAEAFRRVKPGCVIINAARGGVADEETLEEAMDTGLVSDAIIDTWEDEPRLRLSLLRRAYIGTPHIAGYSADGKANATRMSLEAVARFLDLRMSFEVTPPPLPRRTWEGELWRTLYDPREDSLRLKADPSGFEWQRGHYPLRREKAREEK